MTKVSISQAQTLLGILPDQPRPSREHIQNQFLVAAKMHHPDARHNSSSRPCAATFARCMEARAVLLKYYYGVGSREGATYRPGGQSYHNAKRNKARRSNVGRGFPYQTLRVLSLKQNLALRGAVMTVLTVGTLYEEWNGGNREKETSR